MARLQGALDTEVSIAIERFLQDCPSDPVSLYNAIQRSNSSLKRKPKKVLLASIARVLEFLGVEGSSDSATELEVVQSQRTSDVDAMNRSLRMNLAPPSPAQQDGELTRAKRQREVNGEPLPKRKKTDGATTAPPVDTSLRDIGGMDYVVEQLTELLVPPLLRPQVFAEMRMKVPSGILLHGPPGCGKTMLCRAFASLMQLPFVEILGPSIVSGMSGESEKAIRDRFEEAKKNAPCLVFMDEIDAIAPKRESSQSQMEKRIVAQLLVSMDELERNGTPVVVLATTNRPDSLDPALRRGGRFSTEITIGVPNEQVRESILRAQTRGMPLAGDVDFKKLAKATAGYVGADLHDLVLKAGSWQLKRYFRACEQQQRDDVNGMMDAANDNDKAAFAERLVARLKRQDLPEPAGYETNQLSMEAFLTVLPTITPSSKREGFATVPNVSWNDIGALEDVRKQLQSAIVEQIQNPERYSAVGITSPSGVLLWGPPGCGKTLLAKAAAAESKANFISVKGPELLNKFVGESEAAVRRVFTRARSSVPCVIFFDELDALVPRRDDSGSEASARVVNSLLSELDGLDDRAGIHVIGATNRPDMIDDAMLRPGRFGKALYVDLPGPNERAQIMATLIRSKPVREVEKVVEIVRTKCDGFSGADLEALLREAGQSAISDNRTYITADDFEYASTSVRGSVGNIKRYRDLRERFKDR